MASYMIIRHKVRDFSQWKPGYDAHLPKRNEAGLTEKYVLRACSRSSEQHRQECQVNELQAGVEPSLAVLP